MKKTRTIPKPKCDLHKDCFALEDKKCTCLIDVDFGERDCPFYKLKSEVMEE